MKKKIGVVGSGQVAQVLAAGFRSKGHEVRIGSRDPRKLAAFSEKSGVPATTFSDAAAFGEIVVLAVKGTAALDVLRGIGAPAISGKIVIDTTNPIADAPPIQGVLRFFTGANESLMEKLQAGFPQTRFVKAWNSVGNAHMVDPQFPGGPPTMFYCGNDEAAKSEVAKILEAFGWEAEDVGRMESARALEPLCQLWCAPGFLRNEWGHAFKLLKK
jgi:predicted dinucleotide-binding enzyme